MSQAPNNPFEQQYQQPQNASGGGNTWLWVLGIIAGLMLVSMVACCGVVWYGGSQFSNFVAEAAMEEFADDPAVIEHIGEITESKMNISEAISASSEEENIAVMVFTVKGDKGSGKILHKTDNSSGSVTATLVMDSGEEYPLTVYEDDFGDEDFGAMEIEIEEMVEGGMDTESAAPDADGEAPTLTLPDQN